MNPPAVVFDVETQRTFAEVGGADKQSQLGVSFVGVYSYTQDQFFSFFESELKTLEQILFTEKPLLIGFNSLHFDSNVLQPYFKKLELGSLPHVDILKDIYSTLGFRLKLESVAQATLGIGKSGSGLDAIRYYREGNMKALEKYCLDDVRITRDIYDYGCRHGYILYQSGGEVSRLPVRWSNEPTVHEQLTIAWREHNRVKLEYVHFTESDRTILTTDADILTLNEHEASVYAHSQNTTISLPLDRILSLTLTPDRSVYQQYLL